ncbi:unnamed protein product, partial [Timema podura]|nr:unnamed protein product [Timema podura]
MCGYASLTDLNTWNHSWSSPAHQVSVEVLVIPPPPQPLVPYAPIKDLFPALYPIDASI